MVNYCRTINTTPLPSVTTSEPASNKYSITVTSKKKGKKSVTTYVDQATGDTLEEKRDSVFTELSKAMFDIVKVYADAPTIISPATSPFVYTPPTASFPITVTSTISAFQEWVLNEVPNTYNNTTYSSLAVAERVKNEIKFIAERFFLIFARIQTHILTAEDNPEICAGDGTRLVHFEFNNCLFDLCLTYN